jgi:hypothetical protein
MSDYQDCIRCINKAQATTIAWITTNLHYEEYEMSLWAIDEDTQFIHLIVLAEHRHEYVINSAGEVLTPNGKLDTVHTKSSDLVTREAEVGESPRPTEESTLSSTANILGRRYMRCADNDGED